jgi:hypothetical protein
MELMVQVKPNGRMMDHFWVSLVGSFLLEVSFTLSNILVSPRAKS